MTGRRAGKWRPAGVALAAAVALALGAIGLPRGAEAEAIDPITAGLRSQPVPVDDRARSMFDHLGYGDLRLVATEGGHAYYTLRGPEGFCFAVGFAHEIGRPGHVSCGPVRRAIVDFTYVEATRSDPELRVYRTEGIVANGVAKVELTDAAGEAVASMRVRDNVFHFASVPSTAKRIVARGRDGAEVAATPLR